MNNDDLSTTQQASLKNTSSIPTLFNYDAENNLNIFVNGTPSASTPMISGATVSNLNKPGNMAYVAVPKTPSNTQTLITNIVSNDNGPSNRTFNFTLLPEALQESRPSQIALQVINTPSNSSSGEISLLHNGQGLGNLIPIIVGPSSVSLAQPLTTDEMKLAGFKEDLGVDWGGLLNGVTKAIPVIADTGLKIYNELSSGSQSDTKSGAKAEGVFSSIGSVMDIAVPFAISLI